MILIRLIKKITQKEILDCIKRLKNNKAHGDDHVINEYIKSTSDKMISLIKIIPQTQFSYRRYEN
jgi:hypothetical protein